MGNTMSYILLTLGVFLLFTGEAHAYIDPATGSLIFQMLMAAFLSAAYGVKVFWRQLKLKAADFRDRVTGRPSAVLADKDQD